MAHNAVHSNGSFADGLHRELLAAAHDRYLRLGRKATRNYPRKKREKPPGL